MKNPDVPKDLPVLIPANKRRPSLRELSSTSINELNIERVMPTGKNGQVPVLAFNSSV